jgi:hypothetical protein
VDQATIPEDSSAPSSVCVRARVFVRAYRYALRLPWACVPDRALAAAAFALGGFGLRLCARAAAAKAAAGSGAPFNAYLLKRSSPARPGIPRQASCLFHRRTHDRRRARTYSIIGSPPPDQRWKFIVYNKVVVLGLLFLSSRVHAAFPCTGIDCENMLCT